MKLRKKGESTKLQLESLEPRIMLSDTSGAVGFEALAGAYLSSPSGQASANPIIWITEGTENITLTPTLNSSAFSYLHPAVSHQATRWQIATDSSFSNDSIKVDHLDTDMVKTSQMITSGFLSPGTTYFLRAAHQDNNNEWSEWSDIPSFTTTNLPNKPIIWITEGTENITLTPTLNSSAFSDPDLGDTHQASRWQIATDSGFTSMVWDYMDTDSNKTSQTVGEGYLAVGVTYFLKVAHQDNHNEWSEWSDIPSYTTIFNTYLNWSTYLGGNHSDDGFGIATDAQGNTLVTGQTESSNLPVTPGAYDTSFNYGSSDAFVSKFDPSGNLLWSTYLGGGLGDYGLGIALDDSDNVLITGGTYSSDFPTPNGWNTTHNRLSDTFVAKFSTSGNLLWSTYLGGGGSDEGWGVTTDTQDNILVMSETGSFDFPTTPGAYIGTGRGGTVVTKFDSSGDLIWSTYLGGGGGDIATDSADNILVTGRAGPNFSGTPGAYDTTFNGGYSDVFVAKLDASGSNLLWSTFLGGSGKECGEDIAIDSAGNVLVTGYTQSSDFPTPNGWDTTYNGGFSDAFVAKFGAYRADFQNDDDVDIFDVSAFAVAYDLGDPSADFQGDGDVDIFDVQAFAAVYDYESGTGGGAGAAGATGETAPALAETEPSASNNVLSEHPSHRALSVTNTESYNHRLNARAFLYWQERLGWGGWGKNQNRNKPIKT